MILVDTNVFSELIKPIPDSKVVDWLYERRTKTLLSSLVAAEIDLGIRTTSGPAKRLMLERWFNRLIEQHSG
jgi:toxin FitB